MDPWQISVNDRLAHLERKSEDMSKDITSIKVDLASVKERLSHLPDKDYLSEKLDKLLFKAGAIVAIIAAVAGLIFRFSGSPS